MDNGECVFWSLCAVDWVDGIRRGFGTDGNAVRSDVGGIDPDRAVGNALHVQGEPVEIMEMVEYTIDKLWQDIFHRSLTHLAFHVLGENAPPGFLPGKS